MPDIPAAIETVAIIGPGLIGGSFGLGLKQAGFPGTIIGVGESPYVDAALAVGAIDRIQSLEEAASQADLLYLAGTVDQILTTIDLLPDLARPTCLITDVGSTKRSITERAALRLPPQMFVGGHPIAGKEKRGAENADPNLFRERPYILTSRCDSPRFPVFIAWLAKLGAHVIQMEPSEHDATVALSSHLPQLLSTALALTLSQQTLLPISSVVGPALTDMTRLAMSTPDLWLSILETNRDQVISAMDQYMERLSLIRRQLETRDIADTFKIAGAYAYLLRTHAKPN